MATIQDIEDFVDKAIEKTNDLNVLNILFDIKLYMSKTLGYSSKIHFKPNFELHSTHLEFNLVSDLLIKASKVCDDCSNIIIYVIEYIRSNHENIQCQSSIVNLLNFLICCPDFGKMNNLVCEYLEPDLVLNILINAIGNVDTKAKAYQTLCQIIKLISLAEQAKWLNAIFDCCVQSNNLDTYCALLTHVSNDALCADISCFSKDNFWVYIESCISGSVSHLQKQGKFILSRYVHTLISNCQGLKDSMEATSSWQSFFVLIDVGREKQLHLVEPSLSLFKFLDHLPSLWQKSVYKIYLQHSQVSIVYKVAIEILSKTYAEENLREVIKLVFPAINKNEYSDLSCKFFKTLHEFCEKLSRNELLIICEELIQISWNAVSFCKVVQNVYINENKEKMNINLFHDIFNCAMNLPHIFIRLECIKHLISVFWNVNDYNTIFTIMYSVKQWDTINLPFFQNCDISNEIIVSVINDLFKFSDGCHDLNKIEICVSILEIQKADIWPYIENQLHSLSSDVMLLLWGHILSFHLSPQLFYGQVEVFLVKYFKNNISEETTAFYIELFKLLNAKCKLSETTFLDVIANPIFNAKDYNNNQIYVSLSLLQESIKSGCLDSNINIRESDGNIIISVSEKGGSPSSDINVEDSRFVNVCFDLFIHNCKNASDTSNAMKVFLNIMNTQSNDVLCNVYRQLHQLIIEVSNSPSFVRECIKISHETLKKLKKDQYFKDIVSEFINAIYSKTYFSLETDSMDIELINSDSLEFAESYPEVRSKWLLVLPKLLELMVLHQDMCLKTIVDLHLQGMIVTKDSRTEFNLCQEFTNNTSLKNNRNPNYANALSRRVAKFCLIMLGDLNFLALMSYLIERYRRHFKIRYFPDSVIHYEKLRILQALLLITQLQEPAVKNYHSGKISSFAFDCLENETNQNCVRQLLNCILIVVLEDVLPVLEWIESKPASIAQSLIVNVSPAIYHLARKYGTEEALEKIVKIALPWTMGSKFKQRVYAQDLIKRIVGCAKEKKYNNFVRKYEHLEEGIKDCLQSASDVVAKTMKSDIPFLNDFDPNPEPIFWATSYDIFRLNRVHPSEWLNETFKKKTAFTDAVDRFLNDSESATEQTIREVSHIHHIQKKIIPWENALENMDTDVNKDFILVASLIDKAQNLGGLTRTCEVFGIRNIALHDAKIINDKEFRSLSMSSEGWINTIEVKAHGLKEFILKLQDEGYCVIGAEQTAGSQKLIEFRLPRKMALILGNEKTGIPPDIIPLLNVCLEIPQFGQTRSLNVHVAGAMFVWEYTKQHLILSS